MASNFREIATAENDLNVGRDCNVGNNITYIENLQNCPPYQYCYFDPHTQQWHPAVTRTEPCMVHSAHGQSYGTYPYNNPLPHAQLPPDNNINTNIAPDQETGDDEDCCNWRCCCTGVFYTIGAIIFFPIAIGAALVWCFCSILMDSNRN